MKDWFIDQTWSQVYEATSAHEKANIFQELLLREVYDIFPKKERKISSDDQPWVSHKLKTMDRKRIFHQERKSEK